MIRRRYWPMTGDTGPGLRTGDVIYHCQISSLFIAQLTQVGVSGQCGWCPNTLPAVTVDLEMDSWPIMVNRGWLAPGWSLSMDRSFSMDNHDERFVIVTNGLSCLMARNGSPEWLLTILAYRQLQKKHLISYGGSTSFWNALLPSDRILAMQECEKHPNSCCKRRMDASGERFQYIQLTIGVQ